MKRFLVISGVILIAGVALISGPEANLIRNSLWLAAGSFSIAWPTGTFLAVSATCLSRRGQILFWCGIVFLLFLPLYVQAAAWDWRPWLRRLQPDMIWYPVWWAAIVGHGFAAVPWMTVLMAWQPRVSASVADALRLDATTEQAVWHTMLPKALATLPMAGWWMLTQTFTDITLTDLYQVRTYAEEIYVGFSLAAEMSEAAWSGLLPALFIGWLTIASCVAIRRLVMLAMDDMGELGQMDPTWRQSTVLRWVVPLACGLLLALVLVPLASLTQRAGMDVSQSPGPPIRHWSAAKLYALTLRVPWDFATELGWTALLGQVAAMAGVIIAGVWCVAARQSLMARWLLYLSVALALVIPGPAVGLMLDGWSSHPSPWGEWLCDRTLFFPVAALWWHALPWQAAIIWAGVWSLPADQLEQARVQGANSWQQWARIAVPQRWSCLCTAWLVGFLMASSDVSTSILVMPPGIATISVRIFGLLHAAADDRVAALCLFVSGSVAVSALVAVVVGSSFRRSIRLRPPTSYNGVK